MWWRSLLQKLFCWSLIIICHQLMTSIPVTCSLNGALCVWTIPAQVDWSREFHSWLLNCPDLCSWVVMFILWKQTCWKWAKKLVSAGYVNLFKMRTVMRFYQTSFFAKLEQSCNCNLKCLFIPPVGFVQRSMLIPWLLYSIELISKKYI